jgi:hypothetical protein
MVTFHWDQLPPSSGYKSTLKGRQWVCLKQISFYKTAWCHIPEAHIIHEVVCVVDCCPKRKLCHFCMRLLQLHTWDCDALFSVCILCCDIQGAYVTFTQCSVSLSRCRCSVLWFSQEPDLYLYGMFWCNSRTWLADTYQHHLCFLLSNKVLLLMRCVLHISWYVNCERLWLSVKQPCCVILSNS